MNWKQFKEAENEIKSATGSKCMAFDQVVKWKRIPTTEKGEEMKKWMKSSTPYRFSLKQFTGLPKKRGYIHSSKAKAIQEKTSSLGNAFRTSYFSKSQTLSRESLYTTNDQHTVAFASAQIVDEAKRLSSFPLPTIVVQWQLKPAFPPFSLPELEYVMSGFGKVWGVFRLESNSAMVVFVNLQSARRAVNSRFLGQPYCRLNCHWFFPTLAQPNIFSAIRDQPKGPPPLRQSSTGPLAIST